MSKLDFSSVKCLLVRGPENRAEAENLICACENAETILRAASESGLGVEEIVLLLKGNVRERLYAGMHDYDGPSLIMVVGELWNDLTPQGGKEDEHDAKT